MQKDIFVLFFLLSLLTSLKKRTRRWNSRSKFLVFLVLFSQRLNSGHCTRFPRGRSKLRNYKCHAWILRIFGNFSFLYLCFFPIVTNKFRFGFNSILPIKMKQWLLLSNCCKQVRVKSFIWSWGHLNTQTNYSLFYAHIV